MPSYTSADLADLNDAELFDVFFQAYELWSRNFSSPHGSPQVIARMMQQRYPGSIYVHLAYSLMACHRKEKRAIEKNWWIMHYLDLARQKLSTAASDAGLIFAVVERIIEEHIDID